MHICIYIYIYIHIYIYMCLNMYVGHVLLHGSCSRVSSFVFRDQGLGFQVHGLWCGLRVRCAATDAVQEEVVSGDCFLLRFLAGRLQLEGFSGMHLNPRPDSGLGFLRCSELTRARLMNGKPRQTTRRTPVISSKVNLPHVINCRALRSANFCHVTLEIASQRNPRCLSCVNESASPIGMLSAGDGEGWEGESAHQKGTELMNESSVVLVNRRSEDSEHIGAIGLALEPLTW